MFHFRFLPEMVLQDLILIPGGLSTTESILFRMKWSSFIDLSIQFYESRRVVVSDLRLDITDNDGRSACVNPSIDKDPN